ncbi:unnamed protein product [Colias eurytheme]|nr:unnamed protein product [Colias eurytheme]
MAPQNEINEEEFKTNIDPEPTIHNERPQEINDEIKTNIDPERTIDTKTPQEKNTYNYTTTSNETLKEQIDTQSTKIEIMINHLPANANNPVSSIVIHNNTYQEITEPAWYRYPYYYRYPKVSSAYNYSPYYQYSQCSPNPGQYKAITYDNWPRYYGYHNLDKRTSKTWHNLDVSINNIRSERIRDGADCYGMVRGYNRF